MGEDIRGRLWRQTWLAAGLALLIRVLVFAWGTYSFDFHNYPENTVLHIWNRWDAECYILLAKEGFHPFSVDAEWAAFLQRFPPLFPVLLRLGHGLTGLPIALVGMMVSWLASVGASAVLFRLAWYRSQQAKAAWWTVAFFNLFPTAFFFVNAYSEALFACLAVLALYGLERKRYVLGGLAGAATLLTRMLGFGLLPAYLYVLWQEWQAGERSIKKLAPLLLPFAGVGVSALFQWLTFGSPFAASRAYGLRPSPMFYRWPLFDVWDDLLALWGPWRHGQLDMGYITAHGWDPLLTLIAIAVLVWYAWRRRPPGTDLVYGGAYIGIFSGFQFNSSAARYLLGVIPLYLALGSLPAWLRPWLLAASVLLLGHITRLYVWNVFGF